MPNTPDAVPCVAPVAARTTLLPVSPFLALHVHFGMLLGVDDFENALAYPRGKVRLHNAWLHAAGVVWGLGVELSEAEGQPGVLTGELRVDPGLALDGAGHELHLDTPACLDVGAWFKAHADDTRLRAVLDPDSTDARAVFDAVVVARFKACLTRQVPAMAEPCAGAEMDVAYSRAFETVELVLEPVARPPDAADPRDASYHRLRLLFGLVPPERDQNDQPLAADQAVLDAITDVLARPAEEQPRAYLDAFRRFAALDVVDLRPPTGDDGTRRLLFPAGDGDGIVLARANGLTVEKRGDGWQLTAGSVDVTVRRSHVATFTIEELLCGPRFRYGPADAGGPRVDPASVRLDGTQISFSTTAPLDRASVQENEAAFSVLAFDAGPEGTGWSHLEIYKTDLTPGDDTSVVVELSQAPPAGMRLRLVVRGTGEEPLLGADGVPLAGAVGGPPGGPEQGNDFVHMWTPA